MRGVVINVKRPGFVGSYFRAAEWLMKHRDKMPVWLGLQLEKAKVRGGNTGRIYQALLMLRIYNLLARTILISKKLQPQVLFVRNGAGYRQIPIIDWAKDNGIQPVYIENGFLPNTIQLDGCGVNCHNSMPRDPGFYRSYVPEVKRKPGKVLTQRNPKRNEVAQRNFVLPENYYFVPFQVPADTQVLLNSPWIRSMDALFKVLEDSVEALPEGFKFVVKEHPSSDIRFDHYHGKNESIVFANTYETQRIIEKSKAVITLNSTVGVESLLLGKPVITLADACYNIQGLVEHAAGVDQLKAIISSPDNAVYDEELADKFIMWLDQVYLISGSLRSFEKESGASEKIKQRIEEIICGSYQ